MTGLVQRDGYQRAISTVTFVGRKEPDGLDGCVRGGIDEYNIPSQDAYRGRIA